MPRRAALILAMMLAGCSDTGVVGESRLSLLETLAGTDTVGHARATEPRTFTFPRDHGPHEDFRTEWWYVTGNVAAADGRAFGFQFTIFRSALSAEAPEASSAWTTRQAYMGHFTVTDIAGEEFYAFERFARGAVDLAGAEASPLRVWIEDWAFEGGSESAFPIRLTAAEDGVSLTLELEEGKAAVFQGEDGLSRKGPEPGNASYYFAHTRMPASGRLIIDGESLEVSGQAWLDREWSTSALGAGQVGWDWFALQLGDGWDLMVYMLRRADGSADRFSDGALVAPDGSRTRLDWGMDVSIEPTDEWESPLDGAVYPSRWRVTLPGRGWDLTVEPLLADQELDLAFRYWEGAVRVSGVGEGGRPVAGLGYVELTGYAGVAPNR